MLLSLLLAAASPPTGGSTKDFQMVVVQAAIELRRTLRDSETARFRQSYIRTTFPRSGGERQSVCGYINAKNAYGGYTGWERFYFSYHNEKPYLVIGYQPGKSFSADELCDPTVGLHHRETDISEILHRLMLLPD